MRVVASDTSQLFAFLVTAAFFQIADLIRNTILLGKFHFQNQKRILQRLSWTIAEWRSPMAYCIRVALGTQIHLSLARQRFGSYDGRGDRVCRVRPMMGDMIFCRAMTSFACHSQQLRVKRPITVQ